MMSNAGLESDSAETRAVARHLAAIRLTHLTRAVASLPPGFVSPYRDDRAYQSVFEHVHQVLTTKIEPAPHLLICREPGISESAALLDLARQSLLGQRAGLEEAEYIQIDARHLTRGNVEVFLQSTADSFGDNARAVLLIEGLRSVLNADELRESRRGLITWLMGLRCRVGFVLSEYEVEEWFPDIMEREEFFEVIHLPEPAIPTSMNLVAHYAEGMQQQYDVEIADEAISAAVRLTDRFIIGLRLPHKAVRLLVKICEGRAYARLAKGCRPDVITRQDVLTQLVEETGIPEVTLAGTGDGFDYGELLGEAIVGQDHAVEEVATELGLIRAGLTEPTKPASVMLFVGPTGTGKTEMAKVLAKMYSRSKRLTTFTLGNFSEPHSVSGIIGVPAGYVGHDQGGRLITELNNDPYGVFLLDEADKAHPDVMQPFLNLFDEGWLYDQRGVKAYADKAIFIMTTNVGQRQIADMCRQGKSVEEMVDKIKESLAQIRHSKSNRPVFTPEFLARVKRVVVFRSLDEAGMLGVTERLIAKMEADWRDKRDKQLVVAREVIQWIGELGHARNEKSKDREGGRIVRKLIADLIESTIQKCISQNTAKYRKACRIEVSLGGRVIEGDEPIDTRAAVVTLG